MRRGKGRKVCAGWGAPAVPGLLAPASKCPRRTYYQAGPWFSGLCAVNEVHIIIITNIKHTFHICCMTKCLERVEFLGGETIRQRKRFQSASICISSRWTVLEVDQQKLHKRDVIQLYKKWTIWNNFLLTWLKS